MRYLRCNYCCVASENARWSFANASQNASPASWLSQRSLHNAPIFRLLLKVAVNGTHQCDFPNFCGQQCPTDKRQPSVWVGVCVGGWELGEDTMHSCRLLCMCERGPILQPGLSPPSPLSFPFPNLSVFPSPKPCFPFHVSLFSVAAAMTIEVRYVMCSWDCNGVSG